MLLVGIGVGVFLYARYKARIGSIETTLSS